ncbi:glycosyltransferase, partial [Bacillus sp. SS-TM]
VSAGIVMYVILLLFGIEIEFQKFLGIYVIAALAGVVSLVLLEAMACGVPCIGTRVGGIPEVIQHGETGYLCEVGDTTGVANQAIQLLKDEELHRNMGERARESVYEQFRSEKIVSQYETIYYDVLDRPFDINELMVL